MKGKGKSICRIRVHGEATIEISASMMNIAPRVPGDLAETNRRLDEIVAVIKEEMKRTGIKCLWGTTTPFGDDKFVHGRNFLYNSICICKCSIKKAMGSPRN